MTSVYITNHHIQVVVGTAGSSGLRVRRMLLDPLPEGCMLNGAIINAGEVSARLAALWRAQKLSGNVHLVIDSSDLHTRLMETPLLREAELRQYLRVELQEVDPQSDPLIDYMVLEERTENGGGLILAAQMERSLAGAYLSLFTEAKITVEAMIPGLAAAISLLHRLPALQGQTCVVAVFDGSMMTQILLVDGRYRFSKRTRLMSDFGTEELFAELARSLANMLQFHQSEQTRTRLSAVYFCGFPGKTELLFPRFREAIGIPVSVLAGDPSVQLNGSARLSDWIYPLGNLAASN